jgi:acyl carrier protein
VADSVLTLDKESLRTLVADVLDIDVATVTDHARFIEDLGVDSLMALEIMVVLERTYDIELDESELAEVTSLRKMHDLLGDKLRQRG